MGGSLCCHAEYELNWLGPGLLEKGKQADAIAILKLNAEQYPDSFYVYDSPGEAYLRIGDKWAAELPTFPADLPPFRQLQPQEVGRFANLNKEQMKKLLS